MLGDELDYSALSFHDSDPDLPNSTRELELAKKDIKNFGIGVFIFIIIMDGINFYLLQILSNSIEFLLYCVTPAFIQPGNIS